MAIVIFILLELSNILIMYFKPEFQYGNSMTSFKQWAELKSKDSTHFFEKYMVNWVANSKAVFVALLLVILIFADDRVKLVSCIIMIPTIALYYFSLRPLITKLDEMGEITPKGYSKTLTKMITFFIAMFSVAIIVYLVF